MEMNKKSPVFIGLGKTLFSSSVCVFDPEISAFPKTYLLERYSRKKADGNWPDLILSKLQQELSGREQRICENRDVIKPSEFEEKLNKVIPFYDYLTKKELDKFSVKFNKNIDFLSHHYCHAQVAKYMSPFKKAAILIIDGAGSKGSDFQSEHLDFPLVGSEHSELHEECSLYLLEDGKLTPVWKKWQEFKQSSKFPKHFYSEGLGTCYEKVAEFIFASKRASGKVMGLAPFGKSFNFSSTDELLSSLDWTRAYTGKSKSDWEADSEMEYFQNLAASVQELFEKIFIELVTEIKDSLDGVENLIIAGGCALNCTNNMKLISSEHFSEIYVPPFPGDESIGLGCALHSYFLDNKWSAFDHLDQHGYFGEDLTYTSSDIEEVFSGYDFIKPDCILDYSAELISDSKIIGWFQGSSESGPRALGNRSILSRMDIDGRKDYLNESVKFRESFRPYGSSVTYEKCFDYFDIPENFNNPYMSFAVRVKDKFRELFKEATHIDGTSRMQSVRKGQNEKFYQLISKVGEKTGVYGVLNTSLNTMGEPIVETIEDLRNFLNTSNVDGVVIENYFIKKKQLT
ncbi:hypothetical protein A9Q84_19365 [Halobacteriovorax marinus]|uniref:Transferase n=1 Tax=Halobacteriovorax marinus TaxID=97084 RepID=A0A1Y5F8Y7_9BACT|nr:hypothetical protein A9Q84_19365 [Halobacteriovorax marinus]